MRILIFFLVILVSCSPFKFSTTPISVEGRATNLVVPKGYSKLETRDTVGRKDRIYHYGGDMIYYYSEITAGDHEWIDTGMHVRKLHPNGAESFKGMREGPIYWKEVRRKNYRVGYKNVPMSLEIRFDSATNHFRDQLFQN